MHKDDRKITRKKHIKSEDKRRRLSKKIRRQSEKQKQQNEPKAETDIKEGRKKIKSYKQTKIKVTARDEVNVEKMKKKPHESKSLRR